MTGSSTSYNKILGLYGLGMSYQDISSHLKEMYDFDVSPGTISAVTDKLVPLIADWRSRPLEAIYPIVFLDGMYFKSRENGKVMTKVVYNILGVNQDGYKEILGFYVAESEGANFWLGVLNELKQRGVQDIPSEPFSVISTTRARSPFVGFEEEDYGKYWLFPILWCLS